MNNKEFRNVKGIELRVDDPTKISRTVCGYAVRYNEPSLFMGYTEIISPNAITQEQLDNSDVFAYLNHDEEKVLARSTNGVGTLKLEAREDGVWYEFEAPNTTVGNDLLEYIKRGDLWGTSFGFSLIPDSDSDTWEKRGDLWYRTINHIDYFWECSPCWNPAYPTTSCQTRSKEKIDKMDEILDNLQSRIDEIEKDLKDYNIILD